jgi:hypothetical protein
MDLCHREESAAGEPDHERVEDLGQRAHQQPHNRRWSDRREWGATVSG